MTIAASSPAAVSALTDDVPESHRSLLRRGLIFCRRQPLGTFGLVLVVIMAVAGLGAEWIAPYSPTANDFSAMTEPPGTERRNSRADFLRSVKVKKHSRSAKI